MGIFDVKYERRHRVAILEAGCDRGVKPARRIVELAAAGELTAELDGETVTVEPFTVPLQTVYAMLRDERRRRAGTLPSPLADLPPRDGLEAMRRRLAATADHEIARLERQAKTKSGADWEEIRRAARALRELAAVPGPGDPRPAPPQAKKGAPEPAPGEPAPRAPRDGPGADIIAAHRAGATSSSDDDERQPDELEPGPDIDIPHTHIGDAQTAPPTTTTRGAREGLTAPRATAETTSAGENAHADEIAERHELEPGCGRGQEIGALAGLRARGLQGA